MKHEKGRLKKMNKQLLALKAAVLDFGKSFYSLREEKTLLDETYKAGRLSKNNYDQLMEKVKAAQAALKGKALDKVDKAKESYEKDLTAWAVLDGAKLNREDLELINSAIKLQLNDYLKLEEKHLSNYSMLRAIYGHAKEEQIYLPKVGSIDPSEKLQEFNKIVTEARNTLHSIGFEKNIEPSSNYIYRLWELEGEFERIYGKLDKLIHIG